MEIYALAVRYRGGDEDAFNALWLACRPFVVATFAQVLVTKQIQAWDPERGCAGNWVEERADALEGTHAFGPLDPGAHCRRVSVR